MPNQKKNRLTPLAYDEVSLVDSGAAQDAHVLIFKRKTPCGSVPSNSTGAKTGKSSTRAKNWNGGRHPRSQKGTFSQSSQASKQKYGKGGTTAANRVDCPPSKRTSTPKKKKNPVKVAEEILGRRKARQQKTKAAAQKILSSVETKKSMTTWAEDARLRATLERKATQ